jgi:hypothetical protein|tara:strand:- start:108 stop:500 length:393 start_codon:yes stop_codon:yes gene_type:complete
MKHFDKPNKAKEAADKRWLMNKADFNFGRRKLELACDGCGTKLIRYSQNVRLECGHVCKECKKKMPQMFTPETTRGSKNPNAKLTEDDVRSIKTMLKEGVKRLYIAQQYGVIYHTIYEIDTERSWRHVTI